MGGGGSTWEKIEGKFLLASGSGYTSGTTGGEATHTLSVAEMPSHRHLLHGRTDRKQGTGTMLREIYGYNETGGTSSGYDNVESFATGGDQPHNNMPPYLVINVWKRVS